MPVVSEDGQLLTDQADIAEDWGTYYEKLFSAAAGEEAEYEEEFKQTIEEKVKQMELTSSEREDTITQEPITYDELGKALRRLKNRKAPGGDGITNEHLKNIGPVARQAILLLLNSMISVEHVPAQHKHGVIVPIPKGGGKDASIKDNNRGITLLSCVYKLFENILLQRLDCWLKEKGVIDELQGAFQDRCSY